MNKLSFLSLARDQFRVWLDRIDASETYDKAQASGNAAIGFVDCMIVYLNAQISPADNGFTGELDQMLDIWSAEIYQHMINKAVKTGQPNNTIIALCKTREAYRLHAE